MKNTGKTKKIQNKKIVVPIFNDEYKVIVCWGSKDFMENILKENKHDYEDEDLEFNGFDGICFSSSEEDDVIILKEPPTTPHSIGILVHEAVHAINNIFDLIGEKSRDEAYAHSVSAIVREVLSFKGKR